MMTVTIAAEAGVLMPVTMLAVMMKKMVQSGDDDDGGGDDEDVGRATAASCFRTPRWRRAGHNSDPTAFAIDGIDIATPSLSPSLSLSFSRRGRERTSGTGAPGATGPYGP